MTEHDEQVALIHWAKLMQSILPELALLHAIPNGGQRSKATAGKLKAEGVQAGVPDLCLPVARGGYHGLYVEMKWKSNKPSSAQRWWLSKLNEGGYLAVVCYGFDEARATLEGYLANRLRIDDVDISGEYAIL